MAADGLDAVLVTTQENVFYATGNESVPANLNRRYAYAAIVTEDRVFLVCPAADFAPAIAEGLSPNR